MEAFFELFSSYIYGIFQKYVPVCVPFRTFKKRKKTAACCRFWYNSRDSVPGTVSARTPREEE